MRLLTCAFCSYSYFSTGETEGRPSKARRQRASDDDSGSSDSGSSDIEPDDATANREEDEEDASKDISDSVDQLKRVINAGESPSKVSATCV